MKKIFTILIIIVITFFIVQTKKEEVILVNNELNNDEEMFLLITIPGLNTNNFTNYFDDSIKIVGIYPKVNILYKEKIGNMFYSFKDNNIRLNINNFSNYYRGILKKYNFNNDLTISNYTGINIEYVKVYMIGSEINNFMKRCSSCKYEKTSQ